MGGDATCNPCDLQDADYWQDTADGQGCGRTCICEPAVLLGISVCSRHNLADQYQQNLPHEACRWNTEKLFEFQRAVGPKTDRWRYGCLLEQVRPASPKVFLNGVVYATVIFLVFCLFSVLGVVFSILSLQYVGHF